MFAAKQGHANAQFKIGKMYEYGQGVSQNFKTAMEWHTLAAEQGYNNAKENLSILQKKIAKSKNTSPVVTAKKTLPSSPRLGKKSTLPPCHPEGPIHDCVGARTHPNGAEYVGEYRNNKRHGQGTFYFNTGNKYVGKWKDGKTHGKGIYTYADGRVQKGVWKDGHFQDAQKVTRSAMRNYGREQTPQIVVGK
jgi:TPR repeat protein